MEVEQVAENCAFGGRQLRFQHHSEVLNCPMHYSLYLPPHAKEHPVPLLTWLSGLTCTDENFVHKAGAQRAAAQHGVAILAPDTSPRGEGVPDDPDGAWDFGLGAGFYVNATQMPWRDHYRMYDYIVHELPGVAAQGQALDLERQSIFGHSMGGHGALTIALRNPERFSSMSAFSPICAPMECPWGEKALSNYLGEDRRTWEAHDTTVLVRRADRHLPMLVDQGTADGFLEEQLKTPLLEAACADAAYEAQIRMQEGYDHSYFFIASFMDDHVAFHAQHLG